MFGVCRHSLLNLRRYNNFYHNTKNTSALPVPHYYQSTSNAPLASKIKYFYPGNSEASAGLN
jgi:hypothetical protein